MVPTGTVAYDVNPPAATAGTNYDQIIANGITVDLSGATLTLNGTVGAVTAGQGLLLLSNDLADPTIASPSYAEASTVVINGNTYKLYYTLGDGNDLILIEQSPPSVIYVDDSFTPTFGFVIADADAGTTGVQGAVYGVTAFNTINAAVAAATASGTIIVNAGTYAEAAVLSVRNRSKSLALIQLKL